MANTGMWNGSRKRLVVRVVRRVSKDLRFSADFACRKKEKGVDFTFSFLTLDELTVLNLILFLIRPLPLVSFEITRGFFIARFLLHQSTKLPNPQPHRCRKWFAYCLTVLLENSLRARLADDATEYLGKPLVQYGAI